MLTDTDRAGTEPASRRNHQHHQGRRLGDCRIEGRSAARGLAEVGAPGVEVAAVPLRVEFVALALPLH
jgi:hypothetical protein